MIHSFLSRLGIEVWKDIPNFKNYQVSNLGNVRSFKYNKIKLLKPTCRKNKSKVLTVYKSSITKKKRKNIDKNKIYKTRSISVWSAIAFLNFKPLGKLKVVDHIDNNSHNDKLYNLQIISHRKNVSKDRKPISGYTGVTRNNRNQWKSQIFINGNRKYLGSFKTKEEAAKAYQEELKKL